MEKRFESKTAPEVVTRASSITDDLDDAAQLVGKTAQDIDPAVERRVRRKIDLYFMPTFIIGYGLVYYDKVRIIMLQRSCLF